MSAFARQIIVRFEHCDPAGIMFYPRFFALVNEITEDWFAALGHSFKTLHMDQRVGVPTVRLEAEFERPARIGDVLDQSLRVARIGNASCQLRHEAHVARERIAYFDHTIVFADIDTMTPSSWPQALRTAMARYEDLP